MYDENNFYKKLINLNFVLNWKVTMIPSQNFEPCFVLCCDCEDVCCECENI